VLVAFTCLAIAFGPFLLQGNAMEQLQQIATRLFPFGRGLVHAYWAPNCWALYCFVDKIAAYACRKTSRLLPAVTALLIPLPQNISGSYVSSTSGVVGFGLELLPSPSANLALVMTLSSMIPAFLAVKRDPSPRRLLKAAVYCTLASFMLGYHVHEKAILLPLTLQAFLSTDSSESALLFLQISTVGVIGIFPLFTQLPEFILKSE